MRGTLVRPSTPPCGTGPACPTAYDVSLQVRSDAQRCTEELLESPALLSWVTQTAKVLRRSASSRLAHPCLTPGDTSTYPVQHSTYVWKKYRPHRCLSSSFTLKTSCQAQMTFIQSSSNSTQPSNCHCSYSVPRTVVNKCRKLMSEKARMLLLRDNHLRITWKKPCNTLKRHYKFTSTVETSTDG